MLGTRGVPATYGGVERHVEELGARLAARGHDVTVFCRTNYVTGHAPRYRGMRLCNLPSIGTKRLDALTHTALGTLRSLRGFDVVHFHALGPGLMAPVTAAFAAAAVVQTVHGLDGRRAKWGPVARTVLEAGEWLSARVPDATVTVSATLADHYRRRHGTATWCIPNGVVPVERRPDLEIGRCFGLESARYVLFVGRLVPEKAPHLLLRAFQRLDDTGLRLVVAGGSSFTDRYVEQLRDVAGRDGRILFPGYAYGPMLAELYSHAAVLVSPSVLEAGPPLTLLEAASCGTPVLASDIPEHREAVDGGAGQRTFTAGDEASLLDALTEALRDPTAERAGAARLQARVLETYDWDVAADATEAVYRAVTAGRLTPAP